MPRNLINVLLQEFPEKEGLWGQIVGPDRGILLANVLHHIFQSMNLEINSSGRELTMHLV